MKPQQKKHLINPGLSPHLFWDVDRVNLDMEKNASFIIKRVLEYGLWNDWKIIQQNYGIANIAQTALKFRELEPKSLHFIAVLSGMPLNKFRCYTTIQSKNPHWNF
ncbi:MAG: hypothetical protein H0X63_02615 [Flavobacteriales bacterium]|nr:hypothetical protein [Flavobacteriales bacterium]